MPQARKKEKEEDERDQPDPQSQEPQQPQEEQPPQEEQQGEPSESAEGSRDELTPYQPRRQPLQNAGLDHHAAESGRESERQAQREEHNQRVGDASR